MAEFNRYPPERPSKLPVLARYAVALLILGSFLSGGLLWLGQWQQARELEAPSWMHAARVMHGLLFPLLCGLFGYLVCQHIRQGWHWRANLPSGAATELIFLTLIATGTGLYYASGEAAREWLGLVHRWSGLAFPVAVGWHWVSGWRLARELGRRE